MSLLRAAVSRSTLLVSSYRNGAGVQVSRGYADWVQKKEGAEEAVHFKKEEELLLRKLLNKVKAQADQDPGAQSILAEDEAKLKGILGKYNVSGADYEALLKWKHE